MKSLRAQECLSLYVSHVKRGGKVFLFLSIGL